LSKPRINKFIKLANELGHKELLLHAQTHTWLAAKLYLDLGFEPFNMEEDIKGWQILKTITKHDKLKDIKEIPENNMYFDIALKTKAKLDELFGKYYEYSIWHKNGRHDVEVICNGTLYKYKYYNEHNNFWLEEDKNYFKRNNRQNGANINWVRGI